MVIRCPLASILLVLSFAGGEAQTLEKPIDLPGIGSARGWVCDATTGSILPGAHVELIVSKYYNPRKDTQGNTDKAGFYSIKAPIGSTVTDFRLDTSLVSLILGGGRKVTHHIFASQFLMRVSCSGYKDFEGPVTVANGEASDYVATMNTVMLAPQSASFGSSTRSILEDLRLTQVSQEAPVVAPGQHAVFNVKAAGVRAKDREKVTLRATVAGEWDSHSSDPIEGQPSTYRLDLPMRHTEPKLFGESHSDLPAGIYAVELSFSDSFGSGVYKQPYLAPKSFIQWVVVGTQSDPTAKVEADVQAVNALYLEPASEANEAKLESKFSAIATAWPSAVTASWARLRPSSKGAGMAGVDVGKVLFNGKNPFAELVDALKAGDLVTADKKWPSYSSDAFPDAVHCIEAGIRVMQKPSEIESRLQFERNRTSAFAMFRDALIPPDVMANVQLPPMPEPDPKRPKDLLEAGYVMVIMNQSERAAAYFQMATTDEKTGPSAWMALGDLAYAAKDTNVAYDDYGKAYAMKEANSIPSFRSHLNYATLLAQRGDLATLQTVLVRALSRGQNRSEELRSDQSTVFVGSKSYQIYTSAEVSGSVGYAYPEGAAIQRLIFWFPALSDPASDPSGALMCARAMAELGWFDLARKTIDGTPKANDELRASTELLLAFDQGNGKATDSAAQALAAINPQNADLRLIERLRAPK